MIVKSSDVCRHVMSKLQMIIEAEPNVKHKLRVCSFGFSMSRNSDSRILIEDLWDYVYRDKLEVEMNIGISPLKYPRTDEEFEEYQRLNISELPPTLDECLKQAKNSEIGVSPKTYNKRYDFYLNEVGKYGIKVHVLREFHYKLVVIDDKLAYIGGVNFGSEAFVDFMNVLEYEDVISNNIKVHNKLWNMSMPGEPLYAPRDGYFIPYRN